MVAACGHKVSSNAHKTLHARGFGILLIEQVIHTHFYANMRTIAGLASLDLPHSSARTLRELLTRLTELSPGIEQYLIDEHGNLRQDVPIFVNGRNPRLKDAGINLPLDPEDVVCFFSPIASGRMNVEVMRAAELDEAEEKR